MSGASILPTGNVLKPLGEMRELWDEKMIKIDWEPADEWGWDDEIV